ncbi:BZ3500_MvSof-1268-A1-R1_Chr5-2g08111 [Microbotryum saponariae]|uniref:BZ3500_MvSof-1268-A1-R1_Chr5-2g08111 protein n=1 Tax=Microbotryum saponariae TaxID=289078 RepID=A0A2X0LL51_9BASI|nr:BZ3500_MvSof-1268-A1-R1_Chr5-2g08111 [Microbotryum saponariae]SDA05980.1 BZ3501_MvSof-1269-A2-R1_Chr5-2g07933 [Microbotryum saponariae]
MAIVELPGGVEMYYEVHTAGRGTRASPDRPLNELGLNPTAATIVVLTPIWLDCTYLSNMIEDMSPMYNIVAFELRSHGRTFQAQKSPRYDCATAAADIAFAMEILRVPPSHVFANGFAGFRIALKLCKMFPNQVLSYTQAGVGPLFSPREDVKIFKEVIDFWFFPQDPSDFFEAMDAMSQMLLSSDEWDETPELVALKDRMIGTMIRRYNPYMLLKAHEVARVNLRPCRISPADLADFRHPLLLLHGTSDLCFPPAVIQRDIVDNLVGAHEITWRLIRGAPHSMLLTHWPQIKEEWMPFLERHPKFSSEPVPLDRPYALSVVAKLARNASDELPASILARSGNEQTDFSLCTPEEVRQAAEDLQAFKKYSESCRMYLPGIEVPESWDQPIDKRSSREWTFSKRHLFDEPSHSSPVDLIAGGIEVMTVDSSAT